eukprot:scaffold281061_cov35-Attheya_sp.AAC.1
MPFSPPGVAADHNATPMMTPWNKNRARRRRLQYWYVNDHSIHGPTSIDGTVVSSFVQEIKHSLRSFSQQTDLFEEDEHHDPNESANANANGSIPGIVVPKNNRVSSMTAAATVTSPHTA